MKRNVAHRCGHVVEWEAETESEIGFGFFLAELSAFDCPFCGGEHGEPAPTWQREVRFGRGRSTTIEQTFPELVARRVPA